MKKQSFLLKGCQKGQDFWAQYTEAGKRWAERIAFLLICITV